MTAIKEAIKKLYKAKTRCKAGQRISCIERPACRYCGELIDRALAHLRAEEPCKTCGGTGEVDDTAHSVNAGVDISKPCPDCKTEEPEAGEFTKWVRENYNENGACGNTIYKLCKIIDRQVAELKKKDEKFNLLANNIVDMNCAIHGWQERIAFDSENDLISELERMIGEALKLVPQF